MANLLGVGQAVQTRVYIAQLRIIKVDGLQFFKLKPEVVSIGIRQAVLVVSASNSRWVRAQMEWCSRHSWARDLASVEKPSMACSSPSEAWRRWPSC